MERSELTQLVARAQGGDLDAFGALVDELQDTVVATAVGWLGDVDHAHDVAQETFLDVHQRLGQVRDPAAFPAWLRTVTIKHCDRITRRVAPSPVAEWAPEPSDPRPGPEDVVVSSAQATRVRAALEALPPRERLPLALHHLAGLSQREIAAYLELSLPLVKKRFRQARAALRQALGEESPMVPDALTHLRPSQSDQLTDTVQLFLAVRAGDTARVDALLHHDPGLVEAHEHWDPDDVERLGLPYPAAGTPLIRAIERNDAAMVELLLGRGAHPDGACGCTGGEAPLWTAVTDGRPALVRTLLAAGADPDRPAFGGQRPLHVAAIRGRADLAALLLDAGADPAATDSRGRTAADWAELHGHRPVLDLLDRPAGRVPTAAPTPSAGTWRATGIRVVDVLCPLPTTGLVRWTQQRGVGSTVLLAELSARFARCGHGVVWGGGAQAGFDRGDVDHGLHELGVDADVDLRLATPDADDDVRRAQLATAVATARALAARGGALLVLFEGDGLSASIEAELPTIGGTDQLTSVVVSPFVGSDHVPALAAPYTSLVAFDRDRATRGRFPALDLARCTTRLAVDDAHQRVVDRVRTTAAQGTLPDEVDRELAQPFGTTEPFTARPGQWTDPADALDRLTELLGHA